MEFREMKKLSTATSNQIGFIVMMLCKTSPANNGENIKKLYAHTMGTIDYLLMKEKLILKRRLDESIKNSD